MPGDDHLLAHVGRVYDAALEPERWAGVLAELSGMFGGTAAILEGNDLRRPGFAFFWQHGLCPEILREYDTGYADNPRVRFATRLRAPAVLQEPMFITEAEMDRDEYYAFLGRYDLRYAVAAVLHNSPALTVGIAVQRPPGAGPAGAVEIERFAPLGAHYRRALLIHAGLQLGESRQLALRDTLDRLAAAVLLVSAKGRVLIANNAARRRLHERDGLACEPDGLRALDAAGTRALRRAIAHAAAGEGRTVRLLRPAGHPLAAEVFPVRGESAASLDIPGPAAGILIADPDAAPRIDPDAVALVFGLTAKEAALAVALARGATLREAAGAECVSEATMRKRLYRLFDKLGAHRQSDMVRLVLAIATR